ncbi:hypothetical protein Q3Y56_24725 [Streptomyces sp. XD-27]|nr:hypothetical protein [Streptomyces sp. XD-27]WKX74444.1 hypothetical protein Q3Y56_24725 [Streptomyces sp. XD-27]
MELRSDHADDFRAAQHVLDLGAVTVWSATFQPLVFRRTPKLIRQSDPETYHVSLVVRGAGRACGGTGRPRTSRTTCSSTPPRCRTTSTAAGNRSRRSRWRFPRPCCRCRATRPAGSSGRRCRAGKGWVRCWRGSSPS